MPRRSDRDGYRDRGSTQAVDTVVTVFVLLGFAVVLPWVLTVMALGTSAATGITGDLLILGFWSLPIVAILGLGYRRVRGGGA